MIETDALIARRAEAAVGAMPGFATSPGAVCGRQGTRRTTRQRWAARKLLRAARAGTLASSLAGAAVRLAGDAGHARRILRCCCCCPTCRSTRGTCAPSLGVRCWCAGRRREANPQTAPRVTVTGLAETVDDAALKARYLAVHPYASLYAGFGDFALWRIRPMGGLYVGGSPAPRGCGRRT